MNYYQKERIAYLRSQGLSYAFIAADLNISENTIKAHCRRHLKSIQKSTQIEGAKNLCKTCSKPLEHTPGAKKKQFCSDKCRMDWWGSHPEAVKRKAYYRFICPVCGEEFESYGNRNRIYCSRTCFAATRRIISD